MPLGAICVCGPFKPLTLPQIVMTQQRSYLRHLCAYSSFGFSLFLHGNKLILSFTLCIHIMDTKHPFGQIQVKPDNKQILHYIKEMKKNVGLRH